MSAAFAGHGADDFQRDAHQVDPAERQVEPGDGRAARDVAESWRPATIALAPRLPPAAANAMYSASSTLDALVCSASVWPMPGTKSCSCVAKPSAPGKNTPMPPTSVSPKPSPSLSRNSGMPPGSVAMPRDWASGSRPEF